MATKDKLKDMFGRAKAPSIFNYTDGYKTSFNGGFGLTSDFMKAKSDLENGISKKQTTDAITPIIKKEKIGQERGRGGRPSKSLMRKAK